MKIYKSSDLTHKRSEVLKEAKANGVIIQECNTNGEVRQEFILCTNDKYMGVNGVAFKINTDVRIPYCINPNTGIMKYVKAF